MGQADDGASEYVRLLGADPDFTAKKTEPLNVAIVSRWNSYLSTGLQKDERERLVESIILPDNCPGLSGPVLNQEIVHLLPELKMQNDNVKARIQAEIGLGLSTLGHTLNMLLSRKNKEDEEITMSLANSAKLLANAHHLMSVHRRYTIRPHLNADIQKIKKECKIDSQLFGKEFTEKCKSAQNAKKTSLEMAAKKKFPAATAGPSRINKRSLNYQRSSIRTRLKKSFLPVHRSSYGPLSAQYRHQGKERKGTNDRRRRQ